MGEREKEGKQEKKQYENKVIAVDKNNRTKTQTTTKIDSCEQFEKIA